MSLELSQYTEQGVLCSSQIEITKKDFRTRHAFYWPVSLFCKENRWPKRCNLDPRSPTENGKLLPCSELKGAQFTAPPEIRGISPVRNFKLLLRSHAMKKKEKFKLHLGNH